MAVPSASTSTIPGNNKLITGTAEKTYNNNSRIIAALLFAEVIEAGLPGAGAAPAAYRIGGKGALITALALQIEILFASFPSPPVVTGLVAATTIVNKFGAQEVADAIDNASTLGIGPEPGFYYVFKEKSLNIPAGQYSLNSVWRSQGLEYILVQKSQWAENIDWLYMVPNLSWLGEWVPYEEGSILDASDTMGSTGFEPLDIVPGENGESGTTSGNINPLIGAVMGFLVGGPPGAAAGVVLSSFFTGKKDTDTDTDTDTIIPETEQGLSDQEILNKVFDAMAAGITVAP